MSSDEERETWQRAKASRLAAVQALYQIDRDAASLEIALSSAVSRGAVLDEQGLAAEIDRVFTTSIVRNVAGDRELRLDGMIDGDHIFHGLGSDLSETVAKQEKLITEF